MTCPDCERHKLSASMWRNKAYEASGTPLPWSPEELLRKEYERGRADGAAAACEIIIDSLRKQADLAVDEFDRKWALQMVGAIQTRGNIK